MSFARYLSKLGALLSSDGKVPAAGLAAGAARENFGAGAVLQVVQATTSSTLSTTSASDVSTGFSATITPTSSTSKILVQLLGGCMDYGGSVSANTLQASVYRGVTKLANLVGMSYSSTYGIGASGCYYDSPASASPQTYTMYLKSSGGVTGYLNNGSSSIARPLTLTLIEVAA